MSRGARGTTLLVIGVVKIALGGFLALRPLFRPGRPITSAAWLDMVFAAFFLLRGGWNVRLARRAGEPPRAAPPAPPAPPPAP